MFKLAFIAFSSFWIKLSASFSFYSTTRHTSSCAFVSSRGCDLFLPLTVVAAAKKNSYPPECELYLKSPLPISDIRAEREEHETKNKKRFAVGEELTQLRESLANMRENLKFSIAAKCEERVISLSEAILIAEKRDPEIEYTHKLVDMYHAQDKTSLSYKKLEDDAKDARDSIDHFNLHGLWVGKYADSGYQMINVTYDGDLLIATKVAGNGTIASGETLIEVDLSPVTLSGSSKNIEKVNISQAMADKFGTGMELNRFPGKGIVAGKNSMEQGFFVAIGDFLSFAWDPTSVQNHVFFGRPDFELIVHVLSEYADGYKCIGDVNHISRCFDLDIASDLSSEEFF